MITLYKEDFRQKSGGSGMTAWPLAGMRVEAYAANQQLTGFLARARILMPHLNQNLFL
jgi:hypothetical protein